jgi:hypothetical protein
VEENKSLYTKRQVEQAEAARKLYQIIGFPSLRDYKHPVQTNRIKNFPVTLEDIKICEKNNTTLFLWVSHRGDRSGRVKVVEIFEESPGRSVK